MKRTCSCPILYEQVKRLAEALDWSITEVLRRGAEYMVRVHTLPAPADPAWKPPTAKHLGEFLAPVEAWRDLAANDEARIDPQRP
jgi:hypothetical protein